MSVSERQRLDLYERLGATLGREHAEVLMEYLPPVGWGDVARRHDIDALRLETQAEFATLRGEMASAFAKVDGELSAVRGEMRVGFVEVRQALHEQAGRNLMWTVTAMVACVGVATGVLSVLS